MANYAHIENNEITGVYDLIPDNWRNISNFSALDDMAFIQSLGWRAIVKQFPLIDESTQKLGNPIHRIENDSVIETYEVITLPTYSQPDQVEPTEEQLIQYKINIHINAMAQLRMKRDTLLLATDYTQLADVMTLNGEELTAAFNTYRQELRDLPDLYENDPGFLDEKTVVYPVIPGSN